MLILWTFSYTNKNIIMRTLLMKEIIQHAFEQLYDASKGILTKEGRDVEKFVRDVEKNGGWPFNSVSKEYFLDVARPMMKLLHEIENEVRFDANKRGEDFKTPIEVIQDKISYLSSEALKCVHAMELETAFEQSLERYSALAGFGEPTNYEGKNAVFTYAQEAIFACNKQMIDMIKHTYSIDVEQLYINKERNCDYDSKKAVEYAHVVGEHNKAAFKMIVDNSDQILKYGMPSETLIGQAVDKMRPVVDATKKQNKAIVEYMLIARSDMDSVEMMVHNLERQTHEQAFKDLCRVFLEHGPAPVYQHELSDMQKDIAKIRTIQQNVSKYQKSLLTDGLDVSLSQGSDGTCTLKISKSDGKTVVEDIKQKDYTYNKTVNKNSSEHTRTINCGAFTNALKAEKDSYVSMLRGETEVTTQHIQQSKRNKEKSVCTNVKQLLSANLTTTKTTEYSGKKSASLSLKMALAQWSTKFNRSHKVGPNEKSKEIFSGQFEVGGGSVTAKAPTKDSVGTHSVAAEAHLAKVNAKVLEALGFDTNILGVSFAAGKQFSTEDIVNKLKGILLAELASGGKNDLKAITEEIGEALKQLPPNAKIDIVSSSTKLGDFELAHGSLTYDEKTLNFDTGMPVFDTVAEEILNSEENFQTLQDMVMDAYEYDQSILEAGDSLIVQQTQARYDATFGDHNNQDLSCGNDDQDMDDMEEEYTHNR